MSKLSCSDVCEEVHHRLNKLGFKINSEDEDHSDMLDIINNVTIVKFEPKEVKYGKGKKLTMDTHDALNMAAEILRIVATYPDAKNIREFVESEIDLDSEEMDAAAEVLFEKDEQK